MPAHLVRWGALALAPFAFAQALAAAPLPAPSLKLQLSAVDGGALGPAGAQAFVQIGTLAAEPGRGVAAGIVRRQRVAVRIDGAGAHARLSVALATEIPGCVVRVDGQRLSTIPRVIDPVHRMGAAVIHEIEIQIDRGVPAGPFLSDLQWVAETD